MPLHALALPLGGARPQHGLVGLGYGLLVLPELKVRGGIQVIVHRKDEPDVRGGHEHELSLELFLRRQVRRGGRVHEARSRYTTDQREVDVFRISRPHPVFVAIVDLHLDGAL